MTTTPFEVRAHTAAITDPSSSELSHASIGQWGAVIAGILAGFAATVLMATLGTALGMSATAAVVDSTTDAADAAVGLGIGAAAWLVISAAVVGIVGGITLARAARPDRPYNAGLLGLMTWAGGIALVVMLGAGPATGLTAGVGGAGAGAGTVAAASRDVGNVDARTRLAPDADRVRTADGRLVDAPALTPAERARVRDAADAAAKAAATLAWALLLAQIISLIATTVSARSARNRVLTKEAVVVTRP